jgi:beta-N-acetylhexosaminidase
MLANLRRMVSWWLVIVVIMLPLITAFPLKRDVQSIYALDPVQQDIQQRVDDLMATMTLRQKVGQLFMVTLFGKQLADSNISFIAEYQPGAVAVFDFNVQDQTPAQVTILVNSIQQNAVDHIGIPMLVATDQEGGRVWRLQEGFTQFPDPAILGAAADPEVAFLVGQAIGREIAAVGLNMNLAPVTDLHNRGDALNIHRVLNHRTISEDAEVTGEMAGGLVQGMADVGVIGVLKHFPGHSPTETDSHREVATVELSREEFEATNLPAFQLAIEAGAEVVMMGHLYYPNIEPVENLPASLSPTMVNILRDDLGFDGVIMTDALDMGAVLNAYPIEEASVIAIQNGVDLLAMGPNLSFSAEQSAMNAVFEAAESGEISQTRLDESVRRVLMLKAEHGLLDWQPLDPETAVDRIRTDLSQEAIIQLFEAGITVVYDRNNFLPLQPSDRVAIIYPIGKPVIREECSIYLPDVIYQGYSFVPAEWEYGASQAAARNADKVVVIAENIAWNVGQKSLVESVAVDNMIYVSLWKPYENEALRPETPAFVSAYSTRVEAQIALCRVLAGAVPARGQLPMAINGYGVGTSVVYDAVE